MTKYYYTEPLEAAYMAKNFGIFIVIDKLNSTQSANDIMRLDSEKYYIDKDSFHILKPQQWDLVEEGDINYGIITDCDDENAAIQYSTDENGTTLCDFMPVDELTIIQRDEKPFFNPRKE